MDAIDLISEIENDSLNPILLNNLGNYYQNKDSKLSHKYFTRALKHLDRSFFQKDSANFYSFRGVLKFNLNDSTSVKDMEKAIAINPNDSLAVFSYPMALISRGEYEKSRNYIIKILDLKPDYAYIPYFYLGFSEIMYLLKNGLDEEYIKKTNYDKLIDYSLINKYHKLYIDNNSINNFRILVDLFPLYLKTAVSIDLNEKKFKQQAFEEKAIRSIIKNIQNQHVNKKINDFSAYKIIGFSHFMLNETKDALSYYDKAIKHFPHEYKNESFNLDEVYNNILVVHFMKGDYQAIVDKLYELMALDEDDVSLESNLEKLALAYLKMDMIDKSEEYCFKIFEINHNNLLANQIFAYIKFLNEYVSLTSHYIKKAYNVAEDDSDIIRILSQMAAYYLYYDQIDEALKKIDFITNTGEDCDVCNDLLKIIEKYKN